SAEIVLLMSASTAASIARPLTAPADPNQSAASEHAPRFIAKSPQARPVHWQAPRRLPQPGIGHARDRRCAGSRGVCTARSGVGTFRAVLLSVRHREGGLSWLCF